MRYLLLALLMIGCASPDCPTPMVDETDADEDEDAGAGAGVEAVSKPLLLANETPTACWQNLHPISQTWWRGLYSPQPACNGPYASTWYCQAPARTWTVPLVTYGMDHLTPSCYVERQYQPSQGITRNFKCHRRIDTKQWRCELL